MRTGYTILTAILTISAAGTAAAQQPNQAPVAETPAPAGQAPPVEPNAAPTPTGTSNPEPGVAPTTPPPAAAPVAATPPQTMPSSQPVMPAPAPLATMTPPVATDAAAKVNPEAPLETGPQPVKGKWSPVMYGFVEFDSIHDSTESFNDLQGNGAIANPAGYTGSHARTQFGARNSRIGFKLTAPESNGIKTSGILEMDFLGNQPSNPAPSGAAVSEGGFITSPTFRIRHFAVKLENPYVDVLLGQYWQLFGWQSYFHPNTVEIQGVPGQVYSRAPQARLSHTFKSDAVNVELAVAASRPPQRDSATPDGQAGLRLMINDWKGVHTMGGTGTALDAAAIGVSGVERRFALPNYAAAPLSQVTTSGWGVSTDVLLPVIPASSTEDRANALTLNGSWVVGRGIADLFTGLTDGSTASWALPIPAGATTAPAYPVNIDSGLVEFGSKGDPHAIMWQVYMGGIQYYIPPAGKLWVSANYAYMKSNDIMQFVNATAANQAAIFTKAEWWDANLFLDVTVAARLGVEYAHTKQTYGNDKTRDNSRAQFSAWMIF